MIPLAKPVIDESDIRAVMSVLRSEDGRLAMGPHTRLLEDALCQAAGCSHAIAVSSGTSALHLVVRALGLGSGDEVITTPFSFVSSANCILFEGATPVFVDIEPDTLCIDPQQVTAAITPRTRAILAVDVFGHPADWTALQQIAAEHDLLLIEDSAESLGSELDGKRAGSLGTAGIFGFYPNKQITTGEGGAVVTDDDEVARLCRSMANQGVDAADWLRHRKLGYNYRMDEMSAALGASQLQRLDERMAARSQVAAWYEKALSPIDGLILPKVRPGVRMSWFVYVVRLADRYTREDRDHLLEALRAHEIGCSDYFPPIHLMPFIREALNTRPGQYPIAEGAGERSVALPFFPQMTERQVEIVATTLSEALRS